MAKQQQNNPVNRSKIMADIKNRGKGTFQRVKKTEAKAGGQGLPPGIKDGIAKISSWKVDKTKMKKDDKGRVTGGDPYFTITAICVEPTEFDGVKCDGKRATFMYFLNETEYNTFEENYEKFCNDLQLMGIDTHKMKDDDEIPAALDKHCKGDNYIFFNTTARRNKPGEVNYYVQGVCDSYSGDTPETEGDEPEAEAAESEATWNEGDPCQVDYEGEMYTATIVSDDGSGTVTVKFDSDDSEMEYPLDEVFAADDSDEGTNAEPEGDEAPEWEEGSTCQVDYDGELYTGTITALDDETATVEFEDGSSLDYALSDLLPDPDNQPAEEEVEAEEGDWEPEKEGVYSFTNPKTKKAGEYEVTAVNKTKQTVTLKNTKNAKDIHQNVSWDALGEA